MMALLLNANDSVSRSYSITKPSPLHPIVPSECGERTGNLFDSQLEQGRLIVSSGVETSSTNRVRSTFAESPLSADTYTINAENSSYTVNVSLYVYDSNKNFVSSASITDWQAVPFTFTLATTSYVRFVFRVVGDRDITPNDITNTMLNSGSTALPYEPYGYKLPLTSAGQDVDIYLGESQTTRRIKKLVLTGEESWSKTSNNRLRIGLSGQLRPFAPICSHYTGSAATAWGDLLDKSITVSIAGYLAIYDTTYDNTTDFKAYLAAQYANGTPVTVWYILANEETGTLNEPLRKIGDYADIIDSTQTSAQIPTTANSTTISWTGSGLAPSEFDSIQEWVDIPTYTYTNGEWIADN